MVLIYFDILPEVKDALDKGMPVVALESTIITHGMPYPENLATAKSVEAEVRNSGAIPATIAIVDGRIKVGLSETELDALAQAKGVAKVSRRDIPLLLAEQKNGGTTVASTMWIAEQAGIRVFVTGGIGGVHRGAETTFDVSADLMELAQTSVAVVCAGAKAILDLPKTLEYLETQGVPVIGYQTDDFPAFYSRTSGLRVDMKADNAEVVAKAMKVKWDLGLAGGLLIANPLPVEYDFPALEMEAIIQVAIAESLEKKITGKDVTPFLLRRVKELTDGKSLASNIALVLNNARIGSAIAVAFSRI